MKKFGTLLVALVLTLALFGCTPTSPDKTDVISQASEVSDPSELKPSADAENKTLGYQFDKPQPGEEIAVITTNMGTIKMRFFPEAAPKAVYNFKKLAAEGYYNGIIFHRVIADFMIQGGDPTGTGTGGESTWGTAFQDEFSTKLLNFTGSVSMANAGKDTNGSQFFINNSTKAQDWTYFQTVYDSYYLPDKDLFNQTYKGTVDMEKLPEEAKKLYDEKGGNVNLDGAYSTGGVGHTVFAQVFEGMDVVDKISKVAVDEQSAKPTTDVVMEKVELALYE